MLIPPYIKSFIKQENKDFLFKIKYVLFDKIEDMILLQTYNKQYLLI